MITRDGYVDWAIRDDRTPRDKVYPPNRKKRYVVNHSIEGWLHGQLVPPRFLSTERDADGSYSAGASASCTFILLSDGRLVQCFPLDASPWTSGSATANRDGVPIETEGVAGTPLNPFQVVTYLRLIGELEPWFGFPLRRTDGNGTIREHRELSQTACPSGRYAPAYEALAANTPEEGLSVEDKELLYRIAAAVTGAPAVEGGVQGDVAKALDEWNSTGNALIQGLQSTNARVAELEKPHIHQAPTTGTVPDHEHGGVKR